MSRIVQEKLAEIKLVVEEFPGKYSVPELSDRYDISYLTLLQFIRENDLHVRVRNSPDLSNLKQFIRQHHYLTARQIAEQLGEEQVYIANLATRIGVLLAGRGRKRIDHDPSFLNYEIHGL